MKYFAALTSIFISTFCFGKNNSGDTIYFNQYWEKLPSKDSAYFYRPPFNRSGNNNFLIKDYYLSNNNIQMAGEFLDNDGKKHNGYCIFYYENGRKKTENNYLNDSLTGLQKYYRADTEEVWAVSNHTHCCDYENVFYYRNGTVSRKEIYEDEQMLSGQCFTRNGNDTDYFPREFYTHFENRKSYLKYFRKKLRKLYTYCRANNISGEVRILAYFDENGRIYYAKYLEEIDPFLNNVVMSLVLSVPELIPAKNYDGIPIKSEVHFLVHFNKNGVYNFSYW